jgi:hypothetical protein
MHKTNNMKKIIIICILIGLLVLGIIIFLGNKWVSASLELKTIKSQTAVQKGDAKAMAFLKLFINDVLMSKDSVPFEERLKLENAVREIKDQAIFDQWQSFLNAKTASDIQAQAKTLLGLLLDRIDRQTAQ